jgi:uncharacterized protein DUF5684
MLSALTTFAQDYTTYTYTTPSTSSGISPVVVILYLAVIVLIVASMWRVFTKAGQEGWKAIIPFYNLYVLLQIVKRPGWWLLLFLVPIANLIVSIVVYNDLAKAFGKDVGYTLLLLFLPFIGFPMLGFGSAKYTAPQR